MAALPCVGSRTGREAILMSWWLWKVLKGTLSSFWQDGTKTLKNNKLKVSQIGRAHQQTNTQLLSLDV